MTAASGVRNFQSIATLIVFSLTNIVVVFPFHIPISVPSSVQHGSFSFLGAIKILKPPLRRAAVSTRLNSGFMANPKYTTVKFPINFATAPVIAVLFLLACTAIHRREVYDGIFGSDGIVPISIMAFFFALAYIAISLDQTGLIRFAAVWVLRKGGGNGRRLFVYLYAFYMVLTTIFGNDPVVLSTTPFVAYMTSAAVNIKNPRAWIYAQFACANIASAILVSSNLTNLVLSGAFSISYVTYTANMVVPVVFTALVLLPVLLYLVFPSDELIPRRIEMHVLPGEEPTDAGVITDGTSNPSPAAIGHVLARTTSINSQGMKNVTTKTRVLRENVTDSSSLEELLNPHLDRRAAIFCSVLFLVTLAVLLATNAAGAKVEVYAITVPAAFVMLCRDVVDDWMTSKKENVEAACVITASDVQSTGLNPIGDEAGKQWLQGHNLGPSTSILTTARKSSSELQEEIQSNTANTGEDLFPQPLAGACSPQKNSCSRDNTKTPECKREVTDSQPTPQTLASTADTTLEVDARPVPASYPPSNKNTKDECECGSQDLDQSPMPTRACSPLQSCLECSFLSLSSYLTSHFPRACKVASQLPYPLLPFTFGMFILVQGLATKGWVQILANGWGGWVHKTGTLGAIGGMGLVSVLLCNFAGTNIGATIVLSRVLQQWLATHTPSDRTKQASIYTLAMGVNYGAFSLAFSGSLAALLWKAILDRKGIRVRGLDFARYNAPIIFVCMTIGCGVLAAQVYIIKDGRQPTA